MVSYLPLCERGIEGDFKNNLDAPMTRFENRKAGITPAFLFNHFS